MSRIACIHKHFIYITACVVSFAVTCFTTGQESTQLGQNCDEPYQPPVPGWTVTDFQTDVEWTTTIATTHVPQKGGWDGQDACNCAYIPCNMMRSCQPAEHMFDVRHEICWSVGGSVSVEGKTGLLASLFGSLGVSVSINANFQDCYTWGEAYTFTVPLSNCFRNYARPTWVNSTASGQILHAESITTLTKPGEEPLIHKCGLSVRANADAHMTSGREIQYAPYPEHCGGSLPPGPDPYDGKRSDPCCFPLPPCDVLEPGQNPCCACYGPA